MSIQQIRMWLALKLIGSRPVIANVKAYQTIALDINAGATLYNVKIDHGHTIEWKTKSHGIGYYFDFYEDNIKGNS